MSYRFLSCIYLSFLLITAASTLRAQDCPDTQPVITGADIACDQNATMTYTYSTPATIGSPTHSYLWEITPAAGWTIVGAANQNTVQVRWLATGTYTLKVTEWNNGFMPCSGVAVTKTITVKPLLHAYFYYEFDPTGGCYYNKVNFTGDVSVHADPNITYTWDFGDGSPVVPGLAVQQHTFPAASGVTYPVTLTITNTAGQTDQITDYVYVNPDQYKPVATFTNSAQPQPTNCLYNPVSFDASASLPKPPTNPENITIIYYEWDFGDPGSGSSNIVNSGTNPLVTHVFNDYGNHTVTLTVTNSKYCTHTYTKDVFIDNTIPIANFTNSLACLGEATTFNNISVTPVGTITQLEWIFGDGLTYTGGDPAEVVSHTYNDLGNYQAKLRVTNSNGCISDYFAKQVSVNPSPMASFLVGIACLGDAVAFTNTSTLNGGSQITDFLWNFDDPASGSNTSTATNPTHLFSAAGNYNVSLTATNASGCANTFTIIPPLVVSPVPTVSFTYQNGTVNWEILFHQTFSPPTVGNNLVWDFGDGYYGYGPDPSHIYQGPGNFLVTLTVTDGVTGCSNSYQTQVTILSNGSAFFTADTPKCIGDTMHFTPQIPGGNIVQEVWDFGDGNIVTYVPPEIFPIFATHVYTQTGTFAVTRTVTYVTNFYESFSIPVVVYPKPTANFTWSNNPGFPNQYACANQAVYFTDLSYSTTGNIIDWAWDFGDPGSGVNNTSVLQNPSHVFSGTNTNYHVVLRVFDNINNCSDTIGMDVFVSPPVPVDFTFTNNTCLDQTVDFSANLGVMTPGSIASWDWDFGDGTSHVTSPLAASHLYAAAGVYSAILTVTDTNGCTNALVKTVNIMPKPVSAFIYSTPNCDSVAVQFTNQSYVPAGFPGYIQRWIWTWGDGTADTVDYPATPNLSHVFPGNIYSFNVRLTVTSSFGCKDSITHTVNLIPAPTAAFEIMPGTPSCATQVVQFNDLSQTNGGGAIVAWLWNFDDPASGTNNTSTSPSPSHTFLLDGTYFVKLKVTNSNGCSSSITIPVVVNRLPVADFVADSACANSITHFTDASIPNATTITSYSWTFGDGGTSTLQSPMHAYATYGIYNATLTIVNSNGCTSTVTKQVVVHPNPVPAFTFSAASCIGNPVTFTDLSFIPSGFSGYIKTWIWNFDDGSAPMVINYPNSPNVTYTFLGNATSHVVKLTVITTNNCSDSLEKTVNSIPSPIANYSYSATRCLGQTVQFYDLTQTNGGGSIQTWDWNFGDPLSGANNTSTLQNPTHMFTAAGKFAVTLLVTSTNGCHHTFQDTIRIDSLPAANFTYSSACEGNPTTFTDASVAHAATIISYAWDFGDGGSSNLQNPVYTYATYGNYLVKLTVVNSNGCIHTISKPVIVNPRPIPQFSFSSTSCVGNPVDFFNQSYVPSGFTSYIQTWKWDFGDGTPPQTISFPNNPNVTHTFAGTATIHIVKLVVTTTTGCTDSITKTVNSVPSPKADFAYGIVNCETQPTQFTDLSQTNGGGSIQSWNWDFGDPASGANNTATVQNPVHQFTTFGNFTVTLTVTNGNGCYEIKDTLLVINQKPVANFTADTVCQGSPTTFNSSSTVPNATSIVSYSWDFGDGGNSSSQNPQHTYASYGYYNVTLTVVNSNGCTHSVTKFIAVNPEPVADFTFSSVTCVGNPVTYFDQSFVPTGFSSYINQWTWDFGDGSTPVVVNFPNSPNVTHTFTGTAINHIVRLTVVTTKGCTSFIEKTVSSAPSPVANFAYSDTRCANQDLQFNDLSQTNGGASIQTWAWNFGDPASGANNTSTIQDPIHQFSAAGSFTVSLTVTNGNGCFMLKDTLIVVNQKPVANFIADTVCEGGNTTFNSSSSVPNAASIVSYNWAFSDGGTSTLQNPQHTFPAYGYYDVTLTIVNSNGCFHSVTKQVAVNPKPVPDFMFATGACSGDSIHYTDLSTVPSGFSSYINQWIWEFGDGTPAVTINFPASPNINHLFAGSATSHLVKLTVKTTKGCIAFIEKTVTTNLSPVANFSFPAQACENQPMQFTDLSQTNGGSALQAWNWDFGDPASGANNTSTIQNPVHLFSTFGTFTVTLTVTNGSGCAKTKDSVLTIGQRPLANFKADTACLESLTTFTNLSTTPSGTTLVTYLWDFGDGQTATVSDPTHLYLTTGTFNVKLTVTNSKGCEKDTTRQVLVLGKPIASFIYQNPNCAGDSIQFTDNSYTPHGSIVDWTWDFGDGTVVGPILFPNNQNIKHLYATGGSYNVKLTIHTSDGCMAEKTSEVLVGYHPLANFTFGTTPCAMMPLQFTDLSQQNGGPPVTGWLWDFGDPASGANNTSTLQNPVHAFTAGGVFTVRLQITNADGCTDTVPNGMQVTVNAAPVAAFTADTSCLASPTQFYDASTPTGTVVAWAWNFGDPASGTNNTSTDQNPTHIYNTQGTYTVTLQATNANQCVHDTSMLIVVNPKPIAMFQYAASCVFSETQFTDLSTAPGSSIKSWSWNFNDGTPEATEQNPVHVYTTSGTYMVRLLVTNLSNCVDSVIIPVTARPQPVAAYASTSFYCPAGRVDFQDLSTAPASAIAERLWIFEPGYTSTLANPTYIFPVTNTTYPVTLIVTDTYGCKDTVINTVVVKPGFSFTFTYDSVCEGYPTHFTPVNQASGDQLYSVSWNFGDPSSGPNNTSTVYAPSHIFTAPGNYVVKMKAYNSDNCVDSVYRQVTVYKAPEPLFSWNSIPCDSSVTVTDMTQETGSGSIASWKWVWGDGNSTIINAPGPGDTSHLYVNYGTYPVTLIVTNSNGCIDSITQPVQRYACIAAGFAYADTLCARYKIAFADTSLPVSLINKWEWFWGDGTDTTYTVHNSPIMHTYADTGTYPVKLRIWALVDGTNIHDSLISMVRIRPTPITYFSNPAVCLNQLTLFRDTSKTFGESITDWSWSFSTSPTDTSSLRNPSHKYDTAGYYDVKLITMNRWGCKDSLTKPTRVYGLPDAAFEHTPACAGDPTFFTDKSIVADTTLKIWRWSFGDPTTTRDTSQLRDPKYLYPSTGDYSVRMIVQDQFGCMDTIDSTVRVNVTPVGSFTVQNNYNDKQGQVKMDNQSTGADSYLWDFSNGTSSDEENPVALFTEDGTYTIRLIAVNQYDCADTTYYRYELLFKGLYVPNAFSPSGTNLGVRLFQPIGINLKQYHVSVFDIWGHLMWESTKLDDKGSPTEGWDGTYEGKLMPQGNYMWKIDALFVDDSQWEGSDIGVSGSGKTMGTVTLIR